MELHQVSDW